MDDKRIKELARLPKSTLAQMHKANGGLMPLVTYQKWTKDELVATILEDERLAHTYGERLATEQRIFARWDDES